MSTMQKLKAYFGMIPADEVDGYEDDYDGYHDDDGYADYVEPPASRRARQPVARAESAAVPSEPAQLNRPRPWTPPASTTQVRGALAVETQPVVEHRPTPLPQPIGTPKVSQSPVTDGKITTLHLRSYQEARTIGEPYRDGNPVIMDLTEMADADAKRLVDFAAGLAFAMRGSMDKITSKVFLISPPNVDVTAEDRRRLAEGGLFHR
jgi:cell division inhibitor SepF